MSQKAILSCEVADSKTEVKWYKDGKLVTSSKTMHTESKGKSRQLLIESVERKDAGEYTCEAGSEKLAFRLKVDGKENTMLLFSTINSKVALCIRIVIIVHFAIVLFYDLMKRTF